MSCLCVAGAKDLTSLMARSLFKFKLLIYRTERIEFYSYKTELKKTRTYEDVEGQ